MTKRIVCVVGTRPEAIKVAPVVLELRRYGDELETILLSTGQHREMLAQALGAFGLAPDVDLEIMQPGQTLAGVTSRALEGFDRELERLKPDLVLGQGDTTTTFTAALGSFYRQVPFGHIEAGLRTDRIDNPFPEEFNRRAAALVSRLHFAPTAWAAANLNAERVDPATTFVTGNTGIDAVRLVSTAQPQDWYTDWTGPILLLTTHRRENWGQPQRQIATACRRLLDAFPSTRLVVAMHRNPDVRALLHSVLGGHERADLIEPPDYARFVKLMERSTMILSDSGGVQEEAPAFGVPVLVLRDTTERPEGVHAGTARLVGTNEDAIVAEASLLLRDPAQYESMANAVSPYGDGRASARIRFAAMRFLGIDSPEEPMWD